MIPLSRAITHRLLLTTLFFAMIFTTVEESSVVAQTPPDLQPTPTSTTPPPIVMHDEFQFVGPPTISMYTYQSVYCTPRGGIVSEACPYAPLMYQMLVQAGIDPVIELAFAAKETGLATAGCGRPPQYNIHNISCNHWDAGRCEGPYHHRFSTYANYLHSTRAWIQLLLFEGPYVASGNNNFRTVLPIYAPPFENDTELYIAQVEAMVRNWRAWDQVQQIPVWGPHMQVPLPSLDDPRFGGIPLMPGEGAYPTIDILDDPRFWGEPLRPEHESPVLEQAISDADALARLPEGALVVDSRDQNFRTTPEAWRIVGCGIQDEHLAASIVDETNPQGGRATWHASLPSPGVYDVLIYIPGCGRDEETHTARYLITHDGGVDGVVVDQRAFVGEWVNVGTYFFGGRVSPGVELSTIAEEPDRVVRADAVAWVPRADENPPTATIDGVVREHNGYRVAWSGSDDMSGIARFQLEVRYPPSGTWTPWIAATTSTGGFLSVPPEQAVEFRVRARDRSGNQGGWSEIVTTDSAILGDINSSVRIVTRAGNIRVEPHITPETVIAQVCPGDQVAILRRREIDGTRWLYVRMTGIVADCVDNHVAYETEGWISSTLVR